MIEPSEHPQLSSLYVARFGAAPARIAELRAHGSERRLYRLFDGEGRSVVGVENADRDENAAFVGFSRHFRSLGLPVPEIYAENLDEGVYLEEDLGDSTLFELLVAQRGESPEVPAPVAALYEEAVRLLARFQVQGGAGLDYGLCYPHAAFDRRSMMWDMNYFKYYFLKLAQVPFHEQRLENDFEALSGWLLQAPSDFLLYRDYQSRNLMVRDGRLALIDYQGCRRGALAYDLASLLLDAKANLPFGFRDHLKQVYLQSAAALTPVDRDAFEPQLRGFSLIRILQAMGAYGYRGFFERKTHFLQSVPFAIRNLEHLVQQGDLPVRLPALWDALVAIIRSTRLREIADGATPLALNLRIESFAYKHGYPEDHSGHGGGFVFDCRALPNPGREPRFAARTGLDPDVVEWLRGHEGVAQFVAQARALIEPSLRSYQARRFTHLSVAFGCTGGQHRSVYCAEALARALQGLPGLTVEVHHRERPRWP